MENEDNFNELIEEIRALPAPEPPKGFRDSLMRGVRLHSRKAKARRRVFVGSFALAAAALIMLSLVWFADIEEFGTIDMAGYSETGMVASEAAPTAPQARMDAPAAMPVAPQEMPDIAEYAPEVEEEAYDEPDADIAGARAVDGEPEDDTNFNVYFALPRGTEPFLNMRRERSAAYEHDARHVPEVPPMEAASAGETPEIFPYAETDDDHGVSAEEDFAPVPPMTGGGLQAAPGAPESAEQEAWDLPAIVAAPPEPAASPEPAAQPAQMYELRLSIASTEVRDEVLETLVQHAAHLFFFIGDSYAFVPSQAEYELIALGEALTELYPHLFSAFEVHNPWLSTEQP